MSKQVLMGSKILGVFFILLAIYLVSLPIGYFLAYSPENKNSASNIIYNGYISRVQYIENLRKSYDNHLIRSGNENLFDRKFGQFKLQEEWIKENYIIKKKMPMPGAVFVWLGFLTCLNFLIAGLGLIMHFPWARKFALFSLFCSALFYLSFLIDMYSILNLSSNINNQVNNLEALLIPSINYPKVSSWDNFKTVFLNPLSWLLSLPLVIFGIIVFTYFMRPKVKEQFQ